MTRTMRLLAAALLLLCLGACSYEFPQPDNSPPSSGSADFSRYVAVGNSLTAGFADGALYESGQQYSYPALLAAQMQTAFNIPILPGDAGFGGVDDLGNFEGRNEMYLGENGLGFRSVPGVAPSPYAGDRSQLNNFGVPGLKVGDLFATDLATRSPFYARFAGTGPTLLDEIKNRQPTFFTFWVGNNDVLFHAAAGAEGDPFTPVSEFQTNYTAAMDQMLANGAKGAVANIPDVTALPYFSFITSQITLIDIPASFLPLLPTLNGLVAQYGVTYAPTGNCFIIELGDGTYRMMNPDEDFLLLSTPLDSLLLSFDENTPLNDILSKWGVTKPIPSQYILDSAEVAAVRQATAAYNAHIASVVQQYPDRLVLVDMNAKFNTIANEGISYNGKLYTVDFPLGGLFSIDGIHPTKRGAGFLANEFIAAINGKFGSTIKPVDVNALPNFVIQPQ